MGHFLYLQFGGIDGAFLVGRLVIVADLCFNLCDHQLKKP